MKIRAPYLWENQKIQSSCWNEKCLKMQTRMILNVIFSNSSVGWRASQMFEGRPATPVPMGSCIAATNFKALKSSWPYIIIHSKRIGHQQTNKKSKNDAQKKTEKKNINKHQQVISPAGHPSAWKAGTTPIAWVPGAMSCSESVTAVEAETSGNGCFFFLGTQWTYDYVILCYTMLYDVIRCYTMLYYCIV